ncbi:DUF2207 domain-containing protein [Acinetobacter sp. ANC 3832]|uniref:DUF2207 domain-containing protein n=1 Tax=Acinetobacter sp. ANC 3832 TaxID=1977874 RepID=UPI00111C179B|nr:DUF2207 domain-containing protein [Acinetobacter sp. ANC 3832]
MEFSFESTAFKKSWVEFVQCIAIKSEKDIISSQVDPHPLLKIIFNFNLQQFEKCIYSRSLPVLNLEQAINKAVEKLSLNRDETLDLNVEILLLTEILGILFNFCQEYRFLNFEQNSKIEQFVWLLTTSHIFYTNTLFYHGVNVLPFDLIKQKYYDSELQKVDEIKEQVDIYIKYVEDWEMLFDQKQKLVSDLEKRLDSSKQTYDFVLLNKGFKQIYDQKIEDLKSPKSNFKWFLGAILAIPILEIIFFGILIVLEVVINPITIWYVLIPSISLILFLFYFYRINLQEVRSIKSQMMQLELRMALCQFIHNYADDSEKLHKKNQAGFEKFENIIFSPIVASDDNIPTTFDGVEQLAKIFEVFKK